MSLDLMQCNFLLFSVCLPDLDILYSGFFFHWFTQSRGQNLCNFMGTKEIAYITKEFNSFNLVWNTNMAADHYFGTPIRPPCHVKTLFSNWVSCEKIQYFFFILHSTYELDSSNNLFYHFLNVKCHLKQVNSCKISAEMWSWSNTKILLS